MRTSLGISAGNEVVCSALVATAPNGSQTFDYRVVSADAAHSDLGDLVASSIELMTTQLPTNRISYDVAFPLDVRTGLTRSGAREAVPTSVAVAYRSREQAQVIRSATGKQRDLKLIPEGTAALTYLRHTGLLDRYETVAIIDLGASGLSVTVADRDGGSVLRSERTTAISGNAIDDLIYHHLVDLHYARRGTRPNRNMLTNRGRAAKEHLSVAPAVTIDHVAGRPLKLTRADFEELIADLLHDTAAFAAAVFARASTYPEAVAVIGGGANIPSVVTTLYDRLDMPVHTVEDPEAVIAKGAALVADSAQPAGFPVAALGPRGSCRHIHEGRRHPRGGDRRGRTRDRLRRQDLRAHRRRRGVARGHHQQRPARAERAAGRVEHRRRHADRSLDRARGRPDHHRAHHGRAHARRAEHRAHRRRGRSAAHHVEYRRRPHHPADIAARPQPAAHPVPRDARPVGRGRGTGLRTGRVAFAHAHTVGGPRAGRAHPGVGAFEHSAVAAAGDVGAAAHRGRVAALRTSSSGAQFGTGTVI